MNPEDKDDQCESDINGFPVGSPHSPVLEDPDCDGCREEFGHPENCLKCPYRNHPKAKPTPDPTKLDLRSRSRGATLVNYANEEPTYENEGIPDFVGISEVVTRHIPPSVTGSEKFCPYCGHDVDWSKPTAPLSIALPCGHEGPDDANFCPDCGVFIEYDCESDDCNTQECDPGPWCSGFKPAEGSKKKEE